MKTVCYLKGLMVGLACLGMLIPAAALQAATEVRPGPGAAAAVDVALASGGTLRGQVVDTRGGPVAGAPVAIWQLNRELGEAVTDRAGYFALAGLRGGTYQLTAAGTQGVYRLWAAETAPPSARPAALLVADDGPLVRQQGPILRWFRCHPWAMIGVAAAAIAVPIAVHNGGKGGPASPP